MTVIKVKINKIFPNPFQPESRLNVPDDVAAKFGQSIIERGLIMTPVGRVDPRTADSYQVGDGWLRLAGFKWAAANNHPECEEMPLDVRELSDDQMADMVIEANNIRQDLSPIDKAHFYKECCDQLKLTQVKVAERYKISQGEVANTIRLLELPKDIQKEIISQKITETHALKLVALKDWPGLLQELVKKVIAEGMSTAALDEEVRQILGKEKKAKDQIKKNHEDCPPMHPPIPPPTAPINAQAVPAPAAVPPSQPEKAQDLPLLKEEEKTGPAPAATKSEEKPEPSKPPEKKPAAAAPAVPLKWKRKLTMEETDAGARVSLMAGTNFAVKLFSGSLDTVWAELPEWLAMNTQRWIEEKK